METLLKFKVEKGQFESDEIFVRPNDVISVKISNDRMNKMKSVFRNMLGDIVKDDLSSEIINNSPPQRGHDYTVLFFTAPQDSFEQKEAILIEYEIKSKS